MTKFNDIITKLGIKKNVIELTKELKKPKYYTKIKDNIPLREDLNHMADLMELPMDKKGFRYLLVIVDLATNEFDIEPLKIKTAENVYTSLKTIFKRKYLNEPGASLATDDGNEFKGVFNKWLKEKNIFHKISLPGRHRQTSSVESLNKSLGFLFNAYMNQKEIDTGNIYTNWTDVVDVIRIELNKIRKKPEESITKIYPSINLETKPKFKVGDIVFYKSEVPLSALGKKQTTANFRVGDFRYNVEKKKIVRILFYAGKVPYRYLLEGISNASFTEDELILTDKKESTYVIKRIIGRKKIRNKIFYLVWWKGYLKKDATFVEKHKLLEDGVGDYIDEYENLN
jgi:hypothetical protein